MSSEDKALAELKRKVEKGKQKDRGSRAIVLLIIFICVIITVVVMAGYIDYIERIDTALKTHNEELGDANADLKGLLREKEADIKLLETELARKRTAVKDLKEALQVQNEEITRVTELLEQAKAATQNISDDTGAEN